jgi:ABC-type sugar transport system substrate-binding protein
MTTLLKGAAVTLASVSLAAASAACGSTSSSSSAPAKPAAQSSTSAATSDGKPAVAPKTIAEIELAHASPVGAATDQWIAAAAKVLGWKVIYTDAGGNPATAATAIQSAVNQHVDAIITGSVGANYATQALEQAKAENIPTIQVTTNEPKSSLYSAEYGEDEMETGQTLARYLASRVPHAQIGALEATVVPAGAERFQALTSALPSGSSVVAKAEPDFTSPVSSGQADVTDMLTAHPDINTVWSVFDNFIAGAIPAIANKGGHAKVYSFYASPQNLKLLASDSPLQAVADNEAPKTGVVAIDQLLYHFQRHSSIDPNALDKYPLIYKVYDRSDLPAGGGQVWSYATMLAPFVNKWRQDFTLPSH